MGLNSGLKKVPLRKVSVPPAAETETKMRVWSSMTGVSEDEDHDEQ